MKFCGLVLVLALALTAQADPVPSGGAGGIMGGLSNLGGLGSGLLKQLGLGGQESTLPEGKMGTRLYNALKDLGASDPTQGIPGADALKNLPGADALKNLPGADALKSLQGSGALKSLFDSGALNNVPGADLLKSTLTDSNAQAETSKHLLRAVAEFLNALEDDLATLEELDGMVDTSLMTLKQAIAVNGAFADIDEIMPDLRKSFSKFIDDASRLDSLNGLPSVISGELVYAFSSTLKGLFSLITNGVDWQTITPRSLPALWNLIQATSNGAMGSSQQSSLGKMALKMALPPPLGLLL